MREIIPGVYTFSRLLAGRVYAIQDSDGLTLIDASLRSAAAKILQQIESAGYRPLDIRRILITHAHPDHIGGLPELKQRTGAQVISSELERPVVEGTMRIPRPPVESLSLLGRLMGSSGQLMPGTPVDAVVEAGDMLDIMGGLEVLPVPGHAPGHIAFWQPEQRVLFLGDVIMRYFGKLRRPVSFLTVDEALNDESIRYVLALNPAVVCFGHGQPLVENTAEVLRVFAERNNFTPA